MARTTPLNLGLTIAFGIVGAVVLGAIIVNFYGSRARSATTPCIFNLRVLEGAKTQWALERRKTNNELPSWQDLRPYLPDERFPFGRWTNGKPVCPAGGVYAIGRLEEDPKCSIGGRAHTLP
jgi:hypothetical protein